MPIGGEITGTQAQFGGLHQFVFTTSGSTGYLHPKLARFYQVACGATSCTIRLPDPSIWPGPAIGTILTVHSFGSSNNFTVVDHLSGTSFAQIITPGDQYEFILNTKTEAGATNSSHDIWSVFQIGSTGDYSGDTIE